MSKRNPWTARRIHLWASIILAIPMTLMAFSGVLIGLRSVTMVNVPMAWLGAESVPERLPIGAYAEAADGTVWIGNLQGLHRVDGDTVREIEHFKGQEVVGIALPAGAEMPLVATRMAVWVARNGGWQPIQRGRVRQLSTLADGRVLAIVGGRGELADSKPLVTRDGTDWQPYQSALQANQRLPALENPTVPLHQFMRELHSGAYFFGKGPGEIGWGLVMGGVLLLLSLTGLLVWLKTERQRARKRLSQQARAEPRPVAAPTAAGE